MASTPERTAVVGTSYDDRPLGKVKTSTAAVFALIFGFSALICWWFPFLAIPFGLIAIVLGVVGLRNGALPHITGRGVASAGLVLGLLGIGLGIAAIIGAANFLNDNSIDQLENRLNDLRNEIPTAIPSVDVDVEAS